MYLATPYLAEQLRDLERRAFAKTTWFTRSRFPLAEQTSCPPEEVIASTSGQDRQERDGLSSRNIKASFLALSFRAMVVWLSRGGAIPRFGCGMLLLGKSWHVFWDTRGSSKLLRSVLMGNVLRRQEQVLVYGSGTWPGIREGSAG